MDGITGTELARGRRCYAERAWAACCDALGGADAVTPLEPPDLVLLSISSYLCGRDEDCVRYLSRAYDGYVAAHEWAMAARAAFWMCFTLVNLGDVVRGGAWAARSKALVDEHSITGPLPAYQESVRAHQLMGRGLPDEALAISLANIAVGRVEDEPDLETLNRVSAGQALIALGRPAEALDQLDQVILAVEGDRLSPPIAGMAYCAVIAACLHLFDLRRAREWTAALSSWCDAQSGDVPYRGQCQVHRAHIMTFEGSWADALAEARAASDRSEGTVQGEAYYALGELHRLLGEPDRAEDAYRQANSCGRQPEPGLSLLRLAQGRLDAAVTTMRALHAEPGRTDRPEILAAYVEVMLRAGQRDLARDAAAELAAMSAEADVPLLQGRAEQAAAAVLLAEADAPAALPLLRSAWRRWQELGTPYEAARTRVLIGTAMDAMGDPDSARMEFDAAGSVFEQLGARYDLAALADLDAAEDAGQHGSAGLTAREVEVVRLVAAGHTNRAIANQLVLSEKTVARHLSNIYAKLDLPSRAAATAYAYDHGLV
jgi:DNA-binding CsgD family transcriptional regulator